MDEEEGGRGERVETPPQRPVPLPRRVRIISEEREEREAAARRSVLSSVTVNILDGTIESLA